MKKTNFKRKWWQLAAICALSTVVFYEVRQVLPDISNNQLTLKQQFEKYGNVHIDDIEKLPKQDRPDLAVLQNYEMIKDPATEDIPLQRTINTLMEIRKNPIQARAAIPNVGWTERGPNNVGGRTRALMYDPNDATARKVWAGGVAGGVWFNNDITSSSSLWQNVDDFWSNLAISSLAFDPTNTQVFYAGTGEGFFNADAVRGAGIWKTTDGGTNWSQLPSTDIPNFHLVQKVVVNGNGVVFAATNGGLYRSNNGETTWSQLQAGRFVDIEIASNGQIYASSQDSFSSNGFIFKSVNGGDSFTDITPVSTGRRIELAIAPSDPNVVYAVASGSSNSVGWFRKTVNGGSSWTNVNVPAYTTQSCTLSGSSDYTRGQAWYDLIIGVHPTNPNTLVIGGIDLSKSVNGGSSWTLVSYWTGACDTYVHADQHAIVFNPIDPNSAIFGNDGGVFYSTNVGNASNPSFLARNNGYNITQFFGVATRNLSGGNYFLAGAQDNGTQKFTSAGVNATSEATGGDGAFCHIDQDNGNFQITSYVRNNYYRSTNGGSSFASIYSSSTGRFINPTDYDNDADILYGAANANRYFRLSSVTGTPSGGFVNASGLGGSTVSAVISSSYTNNRVYFGTGSTGGSKLFMVDNAHTNSPIITQLGAGTLPDNGYISCVELGSSDNQILVTFSNYGLTSVWESQDGGNTWANKEGNLPDIPIRFALYNPDNTDEVLLATELGVWSTDDISLSSPVWGVTNTGLANVRCDMLQFRPSDGLVVVATHGRGIYTAFPFQSASPGCNVPGGLTASAIGQTGFTLTWDAVTDATSYDVEINGTVDNTSSTSFNFNGASASTSYSCRVRANCASGSSNYSTAINVTTTGSTGLTCNSTVAAPYNESFENTFGAWSNASNDDFNWTIRSGGTPSSNTGPSSANDGSYYIYVESSNPNYPNKKATIVSPCFDLNGATNPSLTFKYHMSGATDMGGLVLEATQDDNNWTSIWTKTGNQGTTWLDASVDLSAYNGGAVKLRFVGTTGTTWRGDMAIDKLSLTDGVITNTTVTLTLVLDDYASETSWQLKSGTTVIASGSGYTVNNSTIVETFNLASGCYDFIINDSFGDGICCAYGNGSYTLSDGSTTLASGGNFISTETKNFCVGGATSTAPLAANNDNIGAYRGVFQTYPNPSSGSLTIDVFDIQATAYSIHTISGKELMRGYINNNKAKIALDQLPSGMYLVKITDQKGTFTEKIQLIK